MAARDNRIPRAVRTVLSWLLLAVAVIALWPAQWGGLTGLTIVSGQSMEPTYHTGDLIVTLRQPGYAVGDVITYLVPEGQPGAGGRAIHRIAELDGASFTTRGDNNTADDPWRVTASDVTGRAVYQLPGAGWLWSAQVLPFLIAVTVGVLVTLLLWPTPPGEDGTGADEPPAEVPANA